MAPKPEQFPDSLQESCLALLAFNDTHGGIVASQVREEHFEGQFREGAKLILAYRAKFNKAPGEGHLLEVLTAGPAGIRSSSARRLLGRLSVLAVTLNPEFVTSRAGTLVRAQSLKSAVVDAGERIIQGEDDEMVGDVEAILLDAINAKQQTLDAGIFLSDTKRGMEFLDRKDAGYALGIDPLDNIGVGLAPKQLLLYVAPKNSGKSWFAVHCGRQALLQRAKVVHITLEMEDTQVVGRYYQSLYGAAWKNERYIRTMLEFNDLNHMVGFSPKRVRPRMHWGDRGARKWLRGKVKQWGTKLDRLVIAEYPSGSLTMAGLKAYLDFLEVSHNFVPHVLIVDYPDLMAVDRRNYRLDIGRIYVELRGLAQERNMAVVAPTQGNRDSLSANNVRSSMISEDVSKGFTADNVLTYSQTENEERLGLARLYLEYARNAPNNQTILLAQSYTTGQYVIQSALMRDMYWDRLKELSGGKRGEDE